MSRFFKVDTEEKEDPQTVELDKKVEETLKSIAQMSSSAPEALVAIIAAQLNVKIDASGRVDVTKLKLENIDGLMDTLTKLYKELPNVSSIMENWTTTLSAYATYRTLKRQERLTQEMLKSNNRLAWATVILSGATVILVAFSAGALFHLF